MKIKTIITRTTAAVSATCLPLSVFASTVGGDYPWDTFLQKISKDLSSNVALGIGIMAIVGCGLAMAFADLQQGGKMAVRVGLGLSVALAATSIITKLFGGGALIF